MLHLKNLEVELGKDYTVTWEAKIAAKIDCYPEGGEDQAKCEARGCIWEVRERQYSIFNPVIFRLIVYGKQIAIFFIAAFSVM